MAARDALIATLGVLSDCLKDAAVIDQAPSQTAHNSRASILRQGLAVLTFATVETFIRDRTAEVFASFTNPALTFADLSDKLRHAVTFGALDGIRFRFKILKPADPVSWLVTSVSPVAKVSSSVKPLSEYSFGQAASNLVEDDLKDILKAFGIEDPWGQMTALTSRVGLAILDCKTEFEAMKTRRHSAAHALTSKVLHTELEGSLRAARALCIAFDLLLSESLGRHNRKQVPGVAGAPVLAHTDLNLLFVEPHPGRPGFRVRREQPAPPKAAFPRPVVRVLPPDAAALAYAKPFAASRQLHIVSLGPASIPLAWHPW